MKVHWVKVDSLWFIEAPPPKSAELSVNVQFENDPTSASLYAAPPNPVAGGRIALGRSEPADTLGRAA